LGQGVGIQPEDEYVYAPIDGEVSSVAESKLAIGISGANDMEVLIHVGVNTVEMKGDGFEDFVKEGDKVKKGQRIMKFSREKIKAAGHPDTVVLLLTNSDDYENVKFGENV
ncbi:MAG: PTS glucose transporter subunit IIA, partial [Synergistaceae bacterium]|nr:PTS glucose transporter subunit IIA [Synergistaceae bacterium]